MVTARDPVDGLHRELARDPDQVAAAGIASILRVGDCLGPHTIAAAVHSGHAAARSLDVKIDPDRPFRREWWALDGAGLAGRRG
jgi:dimethylamine/trimethylamine dehydrogenase